MNSECDRDPDSEGDRRSHCECDRGPLPTIRSALSTLQFSPRCCQLARCRHCQQRRKSLVHNFSDVILGKGSIKQSHLVDNSLPELPAAAVGSDGDVFGSGSSGDLTDIVLCFFDSINVYLEAVTIVAACDMMPFAIVNVGYAMYASPLTEIYPKCQLVGIPTRSEGKICTKPMR